MKQYLYTCYNKNCSFNTNDRKEYERHGIIEHSGKPCYPGKADLELYDWQPQGKTWEI